MGRLIDDKKLMEAFTLQQNKIPYELFYRVIKATVDSQPTAYDVDGVVEQLNKELSFSSGYPICSEYDYAYECATNDSRKKAIEIVKAGGVQNE